MAQKKKRSNPNWKTIAENRKARHNFLIEENIEAGLVLAGTEVKALRQGQANIAESYASVEGGEIWLINGHIPEYGHGNRNNHEPRRPRKLLLHKREMARLSAAVQRQGMTLVPLKLYFNEKGRVKLDIGLAKGKKIHDKRASEKDRDWQRQKARLMRERG